MLTGSGSGSTGDSNGDENEVVGVVFVFLGSSISLAVIAFDASAADLGVGLDVDVSACSERVGFVICFILDILRYFSSQKLALYKKIKNKERTVCKFWQEGKKTSNGKW